MPHDFHELPNIGEKDELVETLELARCGMENDPSETLRNRHPMYRSRLLIISFPLILSHAGPAAAGVSSSAEATAQQAPAEVQAAFNRRYKDYFGPDSQALLPFSGVEKPEWKKILETRPLRKIYIEPDKYYNSKVYSFKLYQATDDGSYYLDAKGGFWGMDELIYGPIPAADLK